MGAELFDVVSGIEIALIPEQHFALGIDRLQQATAGAVLGESELTAQLVLEDLNERAALVPTDTAIGIHEQPLQQAFLAQVLHVLECLVPFLGGRFHLAGSGRGFMSPEGERSPALARALQQSLTWHPLGLTGMAVVSACAFSQLGAE